jgi:hypothetical protein
MHFVYCVNTILHDRHFSTTYHIGTFSTEKFASDVVNWHKFWQNAARFLDEIWMMRHT